MEHTTLPFTAKKWTRTMKCGGEAALTFSIRRPVFPETGKTGRIERYFAAITDQWKQRWETILFPKACLAKDHATETGQIFQPWEAKLDFVVTLWQPPLLSLRMDAVENAQTGRPFLMCAGETWECSTGYPRTLRSFFPARDHRWRKDLLQSLQEQAAQRLASGESLLDPDCARMISRTFDSNHFYLTEEGIAVFFPLYALGPYAEGIPVFPIPYEKTFSSESKTATR